MKESALHKRSVKNNNKKAKPWRQYKDQWLPGLGGDGGV